MTDVFSYAAVQKIHVTAWIWHRVAHVPNRRMTALSLNLTVAVFVDLLHLYAQCNTQDRKNNSIFLRQNFLLIVLKESVFYKH